MYTYRASLVSQTVKNLPVMQETRVRSLGWDMYFVIHDFKNVLPLFLTKVNSRLKSTWTSLGYNVLFLSPSHVNGY